jgi:hypothetical protein
MRNLLILLAAVVAATVAIGAAHATPSIPIPPPSPSHLA